MQNKTLLLALLLSLPLQARAVTCNDSQASADLKKRGRIIFTIYDEACVEDGEGKKCFKFTEREGDYCEDAATVVKKSCKDGKPHSEVHTCPQPTKCVRGQCE